MTLRSPLSRVTGLGAAKEGSEHWWVQRLTSVALVLLTLWFLFALLSLGQLDYASVRGWLSRPLNSALAVLLAITAVYHSQLGVQVVLEDYVGHGGAKVVSLIANQFVHVTLGTVAVFAVLRVAFGGAA